MKIHRFLIPITILLLGAAACEYAYPITANPSLHPVYLTASMVSALSRTIRPSATNTLVLSPTRTATKTPRSWTDLHTAGPYLFIPADDLSIPYRFYELDGSGRMEFGKTRGADCVIQENIRWCAYISGNGSFDGSYPEGGVVLRLLDNWSGKSVDVAVLLPPDYLQRQQRMIEKIKMQYSSVWQLHGADLEGALEYLAFIFSWSPNGRYLAFTAMIDGDSTDVYVYDADTGTVQREDDGLLNVSYFFWSPDGTRIIFRDGIPRTDANQLPPSRINPLKVIPMDIAGPNFTVSDLCPLYWLSSSELLLAPFRESGVGDYVGNALYIADISKGTQNLIWKGWWAGFAIDRENGTMLISSPGPCDGNTCPERNPGLFLGPMRGDMVRIADGQFFTFYYRNGLLHRFILSSYDNDAKETTIIGVSSEGNVDTLGVWKNYPHISLSPDSRWMAVTDGGNMTLFDESDRIAYVFNQGLRTDIAWKTNSQGLFVKTDREVYYLPATDPVPELLFECDSPECNPKGKIYLLPGIYVSSLPNLRTRPPAVDNPSEGKSFWSAVEYRDLAQPGTNEYSADIPAHAERRWNFSWCATTAEGLAQALSPLDIEFLIGGQKVGEDAFRIYDRAEGGWQCRTWAILTAGWQPGDQTDLEIRYTLRQSVSDGKTAYPAGEYRQIIHVAVT